MKTIIDLTDPYFHGSKIAIHDQLEIHYPVAVPGEINQVIREVKRNAAAYYSQHKLSEIMDQITAVDQYFCDADNPEISSLINHIHATSGFSVHDIERYGLGIFPLLVNYERERINDFIPETMKSKKVVRTVYGYLKRFGNVNPFKRWREPELLSHFLSGNVVGYTSILSRIGFPIRQKGAAQILKLPSTSSFFPMVYLERLKEMEPDLRKTIACGYWSGGDYDIENPILAESDAINVLSSDQVIEDINRRLKKVNPGARTLMHGHKIGLAYIAKEFSEDREKADRVLDGLVRDISAFDGGACFNVKNIYVQGDAIPFAQKLFDRLTAYGREISPVSNHLMPIGKALFQVYRGSGNVLLSEEKNAFVRVSQESQFWKPDDLFRYVQVMPVRNENEVYHLIRQNSHYLQTAIIAVPDERILPVLDLFGTAGVSNIHYPGSGPLFNVFEEPHDGEFDFLKVRLNYKCRFAATNFKMNSDWLQ